MIKSVSFTLEDGRVVEVPLGIIKGIESYHLPHVDATLLKITFHIPDQMWMKWGKEDVLSLDDGETVDGEIV